MKKILYLFLILVSDNLFGQMQSKLNSILAQKDFIVFKQYADSLSNSKTINGRWQFLRDLAPGYMEGIFLTNGAMVEIIATKEKIVYYELFEYRIKQEKNQAASHPELSDIYVNDSLYKDLKRSFLRVFRIDLNKNELFSNEFVFGYGCGFAGSKPKGREIIDLYVKRKDKSALLKWLKSPNTEKQLYAVDGIYQLKRNGIVLSQEEMDIITYVINKKGTVNTCSGCIYGHQEIIQTIKMFE